MAPGLSPQDTIFITYSSPTEFKSPKNRRAVSSIASKSYRPTSKQILLDGTHYRPFVRRPDGTLSSAAGDKSKKKSSLSHSVSSEVGPARDLQLLDERVLGSPLTDPFTTYPISYKPYLPFLMDYFIRFLTPRFSPALAVEASRYLTWFNVAMHNSELFHALIALSQVYYNIDVKGFGHPHCTALYHRGEALKQLRLKVETALYADDDAAVLTALWLMDVDAAHGDLQAYAMHKRAKQRMVSTRGGIKKLDAELQDELLKSEFFLPLLLHGRFVCELTPGDEVLVRFQEDNPVHPSQVDGLSGLFCAPASRGLITSQAVEILQRIFLQVSRGPDFLRKGKAAPSRSQSVDQAFNEMSRVLHITDEMRPRSLQHRLLLALLVYIFNFHNQPQPQPLPPTAPSFATSPDTTAVRHPHLEILSDVALELSCPGDRSRAATVTEREVTLWTVVAIGAASNFSPWRLDIPFMGHLIERMEKDQEEDEIGNQDSAACPRETGRSRGRNLDKLTSCLRGYYLYGADKRTLQSLQKWKGSDWPV